MAAHLRSAASSQAPVVASVPKDAILTSFQPCARGWCAVEYKGIRGWIYDVLITEAPGNSAPATAPQPVARVTLQQLSPAAAPKQAPSAGQDNEASLRLTGLAAGEILPMREGPLDTARVVGALSPAATGIADLKACVRQWCLIEHDGVKGYVQSRFLDHLKENPGRRYSVTGERSAKVFSFGGPDADVVGEIPLYASGIVPIGECNAAWCHVRYLGLVGFVDTRSLRPEQPQGDDPAAALQAR